MSKPAFRLSVLAAFGLVLAPAESRAQTIALSSGVQKYSALSNTIVNLSGKCELWVTGASAPLSLCSINLNSADAWLFLPAVKPSVVTSAYLGQIFVNGSTAVADSNVRVVQYGQNGTVVIPQGSSFQPLTVFSDPQFGGAASSYGQWTRYAGGLGAFSSFKLKRGYQAVLAQSTNGANCSKCYIAQDGDLEIGLLPATLDRQVQFIYVTPWRWTSKKGIAGDPGLGLLGLNWWYDWNINSSSSSDLEYVAIRQQRWWPGLGQDWRTLGISTVLGYNEPDNPTQANLAVGDALWSWPDLLATGLRVGSPAVRDSGRSSWLYPFVQQADAAGLRVDVVAVHYYWAWDPSDPSGAANLMYGFLLDIWNNTHRPIWITEWNNGANWTDNSPYAPPTYAQQQACIAAMTQMLENTPFVERYSLYNWVEDVRAVTTNGVLTPAGVTYSNIASSLSYSQAMPDNGTRGMAQYLFMTNTLDASGYCNNALAAGAPAFASGHTGQAQALVLDGANNYLQLPANIAKGSAFTFAAWVYWNGGGDWQRIFDFGNDTSHYLFLTPRSGGGTLRFAINNGGGEQILERTSALVQGSWQHVAVTLNGNTAVLYVNGAQAASSTGFSIAPSAFSPLRNYLGKSQFPADPLLAGKLDDVIIADYAMTAAQISTLYTAAPPSAPAFGNGVWTLDGSGNWGAGGNWSGGAIANGGNGINYSADFSTLDLSADRVVTLDSPRTIGVLRFGDLSGTQNWALTSGNTLTLDTGSAYVPAIVVNQNTTTISAPLTGTNGLVKTGSGALALNGTNTLRGGLTVSAGAMNITGGATAFGNRVSRLGYLTGAGALSLTGGSLGLGGELQVGGSDQSGSAYNAVGTVTVSNATLFVGALTVARGNYLDNSVSGTVNLQSGGVLISTNDAILQFAGSGRGKLALNGGTFVLGPTGTRWFMIGFYDSGAGELDITNGNLFLENSSSLKLCRSGNTGANIVNQVGGNVTFYSDAGVTVGGGGNLDLNYAGGSSSTSAYNLQGGTLTVPQIIASSGSGSGVFLFNGGTLAAAASSTAFMQGLTAAYVKGGGAIIDTGTNSISIAQALRNTGFDADGGLTKFGNGTLLLNGLNTYTNTTTVAAGTLGGVGTIAGALTVNSGAGLAPGASIGTLSVNGNIRLNAGSTNVFEVNGSTSACDLVVAGGGVTYGGVLKIVPGGTFTNGQQFVLFSGAGAVSASNFSSLQGSPGPGLAFTFTNGVLSVGAVVTGPIPTSVTPSSVVGSSFPVSLALSGSGFDPACSVLLTNLTSATGASYTPAFNSSSSLTVSFVPGTTACAWNATVVNPGPAASGQVAFSVTAPTAVSINPHAANSAGAGKLVLSGTGGTPNYSYAVVGTTNLNPPVVWTPTVTNTFDGSGNFFYTNTINAAMPVLFLRIEQ